MESQQQSTPFLRHPPPPPNHHHGGGGSSSSYHSGGGGGGSSSYYNSNSNNNNNNNGGTTQTSYYYNNNNRNGGSSYNGNSDADVDTSFFNEISQANNNNNNNGNSNTNGGGSSSYYNNNNNNNGGSSYYNNKNNKNKNNNNGGNSYYNKNNKNNGGSSYYNNGGSSSYTNRTSSYNNYNYNSSVRRVDDNLFPPPTMMLVYGLLCSALFLAPRMLRSLKRRQKYKEINGSSKYDNEEFIYFSHTKGRRKQVGTKATSGTYMDDPVDTKTFQMLRHQGVRLIGHGIHSEPRYVWINMHDQCFSWASEHQRLDQHDSHTTVVRVKGTPHEIPWSDVVYVDVGRKTKSFKSCEDETVADHCCFSLLTTQGTLDLQAASLLERDSIVACIAHTMDTLHPHWRDLAATASSAGGAPSLVLSSANGLLSDLPVIDGQMA